MARGLALPSPIAEREQRTDQLLASLASAVDAERRRTVVAELVELNLPLSDALAARYLGRGAERDDLVQVARTALLLAIDRFDPAAGGTFAAFAVPTITGELKRYFRDHCWTIRPPRQVQELWGRALDVRQRLEQDTGREISDSRLGAHLGVDERELGECLAAARNCRPMSLDIPAHPGAPSALGGSLAEDGLAEEVCVRLDLRRALATLSPRERQVLRWRFEEERTQSEIASRLGVSQMQVSRIIRRLLDQARRMLEAADCPAG